MLEKLDRPFVHLLFGARQTGKSTLLNEVLPKDTLRINLADPQERSRHLANPGEFARICQAMPADRQAQFVFVDEAQTVPLIFDAVQFLYDQDKTRWRFVLCGSSARKLRLAGTNLLPGRSFLHHLYPLITAEQPSDAESLPYAVSPLSVPWPEAPASHQLFPKWDLLTRLTYGALPGIVSADVQDRSDLLKAYSFIHLEEEIRREAMVKDWGAFVRFLKLAASESGRILNYSAISQEAGISTPTVKSYYQLLEDMFVGFSVSAYSKSPRKNLLSTPKFLFFDLGVRHAAMGMNVSVDIVTANPGPVFEQWVGIELWKRLAYLGQGQLHHQRSKDGAEIDFIVELEDQLIPIEVKWTENPTLQDARHLVTFLKEKPTQAKQAYIVCRCPRPMKLQDQVTALPWSCL